MDYVWALVQARLSVANATHGHSRLRLDVATVRKAQEWLDRESAAGRGVDVSHAGSKLSHNGDIK